MRRKSNGVRLLAALIAVVVVTLVTAFLLMRGLFVVRSVQVTGVEASICVPGAMLWVSESHVWEQASV